MWTAPGLVKRAHTRTRLAEPIVSNANEMGLVEKALTAPKTKL